MTTLDGQTIAILVTNHGVEQDELAEPHRAVTEAGGTAVIVAPEATQVQSLVGDKDRGRTFAVDVTVDQAGVDDFDGLVLPGGTLNADSLRLNQQAIDLVAAFSAAKKPIAAICHGPWALVEADVLGGKTLTSYPSLRTDIRNADGSWVDQEVKVCPANGWTLITSRTPDDLPAFNAALLAEFALQ